MLKESFRFSKSIGDKKMEERKRATATATHETQYKDSEKHVVKLSARQKRILSLLSYRRMTVTELVYATGFSDQRGYISILRSKNINVKSQWIKRNDVRYKRYWI